MASLRLRSLRPVLVDPVQVGFQLSNLLQDLRRDFETVILDLPPMLSCDDVFRILPQIDCVLLVAAVGVSKVSEVEECLRHLPSQLIRLVLNKSSEASLDYYY